MIEIAINNFVDVEHTVDSMIVYFRSRYDDKIFTEEHISNYGPYRPYSYKFIIKDQAVANPTVSEDFFKTTNTITLEDCLNLNYTAIEIMISENNVHKVINGQHRILRILWQCLNNHININKIKIKCTIKEYA
jgi:hypothetical protein